MLRDEESVIKRLGSEIELSRQEAELYLRILKEGELPKTEQNNSTELLLSRGIIVLAGDDRKYIPVHPRLAIANFFRTYQERVSRELKEKRMRVDKLIFELIPVYEAAMEKRLTQKGKR